MTVHLIIKSMMKLLRFALLLLLPTAAFTSCYYDNEEYLYGPDECSSREFSYREDSVDVVFMQNCAISGCHGDLQSPLLTDLESIQANAQNILIQVESGAMPLNGSLTEEQKQKITCWIKQGANDN